MYKTLHLSQPFYLQSLMTPEASLNSTRSFDLFNLSVPWSKTVLCRRAFSITGHRLWNSLSVTVRCAKFVLAFRPELKIHPFLSVSCFRIFLDSLHAWLSTGFTLELVCTTILISSDYWLWALLYWRFRSFQIRINFEFRWLLMFVQGKLSHYTKFLS